MKYAPWVAVVALIVALVWQADTARYATAESARLASVADSLRRVTARVDTVYAERTRTLTRWRDSVVTLRDSLTLTDTVEVVRFIATQDSTLAACTAVVLTCDERVRVRDARLVVEGDRYRALEATIPTRWDRMRRSVRDGLIGAGVYAVITAMR